MFVRHTGRRSYHRMGYCFLAIQTYMRLGTEMLQLLRPRHHLLHLVEEHFPLVFPAELLKDR
jgi:hypothetical protein